MVAAIFLLMGLPVVTSTKVYLLIYLPTVLLIALLSVFIHNWQRARRVVLSFLGFLLLIWIGIQTEWVQNKLVSNATTWLSRQLGTPVRIQHVSLSLFNKLNLNGVLVKDQQKDTLLYAGELRLRITDWFFLKDKADVTYVGLEDAVVKLYRHDSTWNYQYMVDFFSGSSKKTTKKQQNFALDLKKVDLKNVSFLQNDEWIGETITAKVNGLVLNANKCNFTNSSFDIANITLTDPFFELKDFDGRRPAAIALRNKKEMAARDTGLRFNPGIWLKVAKLQLHNGTFATCSDNDAPVAHFDGAHILFKQINGTFQDVRFVKDTLTASVQLKTRERSGFEVKKLQAKLKITPEIMEFAQLDLHTNKSKLGDYYAMRYRHFNYDFAHYITQVAMTGRFKNTLIASDDIAFFAPQLRSWKKQAVLSGIAKGTVADFTINNLMLRSGTSTAINGNLAMKGLPDIDNTIIRFNKGTIYTNATDVAVIIPELRTIQTPNITALGNVLFRGDFNGTIHNFTTNSVLSTALGSITNNIAMQLPQKGDHTYKGKIIANRFHLGKFLNTSTLGLIDFNGNIEGSSFTIDRLRSTLDGTFSRFDFNGYAYTNIVTKGTFQKKYFIGEVKISDPNIDFTSNIEVDLTKKLPRFNVLGDLVKSDFNKLNFTPKENYRLTGLFDLNFSGSNIDEFLGTAKLLNANLTYNGNRIAFDSLIVQADVTEGNKTLSATSNEFSFGVSGKSFKLLDLPVYFQSYLHKYYPTYFAAPVTVPQSQEFSVYLYTREFDKYATLFDKKLSGLDYASIYGTVNQSKNVFSFAASIPNIRYDKYLITDATFKGEGNADTLNMLGDVGNVLVGDSINFPNTKLSVISSNDHSKVQLQMKADNTLNEALINADVYTLEDGVRLHFNPSSFVINEKKWQLERQGEIVVRKNFITTENVKFTQGFQEIKIESELENDGGNANNLILKVKNVFLGDITSLFTSDNKLEGLLNGDVRLNDFFGDFSVDANLKAEQFTMNADSIGLLTLKGGFDKKNGVINYDVSSNNEQYRLHANGYYSTKDSTGRPLAVNIRLDSSKINLIQQFLGDIFTNIGGMATGNLLISGNPEQPDLNGNITLKKAGLKVNYTQVYYTIDSALLQFTNEGINFNTVVIKDKFNNVGVVKGKLLERGFKNMVFDFTIATNKLLLLDTKLKDNNRFYGKAVGKANISFSGPESAAKLKIVADANDSSHIFIPNSVSRESGEADFIVFKQHGDEMQVTKPKSNFDLLVDLDVTANSKVAIDVILDDLTGDVIKANGNGRLRITGGTSADVNMKGRYNINKGSYNFNFQSFIKKPFDLLPEAGNYIEWNGDPFKADIHIDASYTADNVGVGELISGQQAGVNTATKSYRGPVYVIAELRDKLTKPTISFKLDFPQNSPIKTDAVFAQFLTSIQSNQNEMLSQASSLIVFGTFAPYGQGFLGGNSTASSFTNYGVTTITQILTKEVNKAVSNLLFKLTKDKSLKFDIGANVYSSSSIVNQGNITANSNSLDRSRLNFKVGKSFFDEKVVVSFGADLDFNVGNTSNIANGNFQWLPDLNVEFILTQDRRLRAIAFSKNSLDISGNSLGRRNRQGVSLSYKKDFEHSPFEKQVTLNPLTTPLKKEDEIKVELKEKETSVM